MRQYLPFLVSVHDRITMSHEGQEEILIDISTQSHSSLNDLLVKCTQQMTLVCQIVVTFENLQEIPSQYTILFRTLFLQQFSLILGQI